MLPRTNGGAFREGVTVLAQCVEREGRLPRRGHVQVVPRGRAPRREPDREPEGARRDGLHPEAQAQPAPVTSPGVSTAPAVG
ncbi:hypothetical protein ACGFXC_36250 [Streptomyces sp. NPDC048507]|uniref:hypothetical protein n=1 Tax=Streptomyces sp. NPDC048507 TaxID=3365560 RepID=UPI0037112002